MMMMMTLLSIDDDEDDLSKYIRKYNVKDHLANSVGQYWVFDL